MDEKAGTWNRCAHEMRAVAEENVADLAAARRRWKAARAGRPIIEFSPEHTTWTKMTLGTGFDRRVKQLFDLDPIPDALSNPPPWLPYDLLGFPVGTRGGHFGEPPSGDELEEWKAGVADRQAQAEAEYERSGFSSIYRTDPMAPGGGGPIPPSVITELDALTELAFTNLVHPFAHLSPDERLPAVIEIHGVERTHHLHGANLILGHDLVEVKLASTGEFPRKWVVQVLRYLLCDTDDHYGFDGVTFYEGRTGCLVTFPLHELFKGGRAGLEWVRAAVRPTAEAWYLASSEFYADDSEEG